MADEETTGPDSEETTDAAVEPEEISEETTAAEPDWKSQSRKHERRAKEAAKRAEQAEAKLREQADADKSEQEKAIDAARKEAAAAAKTEALAELREDRLEVAVTRLANGIKIKDGDKDVVVKFADPDDALVHIGRAIRAGDVDEDDIFSAEGKVQPDALEEALLELLERKPHLKATENGSVRPSGSADGGKGSGPGKDEESLSVDERFNRLTSKK